MEDVFISIGLRQDIVKTSMISQTKVIDLI